ncbi:MAG: fumarylacetoacetase [Phycisphaerales bacterium]|jgi:fumarylacetoacetase
MPHAIDDTHNPDLRSWIESANSPDTDFPVQNLPLCCRLVQEEIDGETEVFSSPCVRVGDVLIDLNLLAASGITDENDDDWDEVLYGDVFETEGGLWARVRPKLQALLLKGEGALRDSEFRDQIVVPAGEQTLIVPAQVEDYTDFYASLFHATNVGSMFRPDNPLLPNYKHIPIAYHGRASTVVPSGTPVRRPVGQTMPAEGASQPNFGPCKLLDYELEVGFVVGRGSDHGEPIDITDAEDHILGLCLVNDWSARDMQKWEYQPLGPFLAKSFATTVSPYIVTLDALAPFRNPAYARPETDPTPLPYLMSDANTEAGGIDITLEVWIASAKMREQKMEPVRLSKGSFKDMYWTIAQMLTHHASNGCLMQPGDLLASGTVSGTTRDERGSMLELTWDGDPFATPPVIVPGTQRTPITLPTGEERKFLADGDEVILKGYCEREGFRRIGFGECRGIVEPARKV